MRRRDRGGPGEVLPASFWSALDEGAVGRAVRIARAAGCGPITALQYAVAHRRGAPPPWDPGGRRCPCPLHRDDP